MSLGLRRRQQFANGTGCISQPKLALFDLIVCYEFVSLNSWSCLPKSFDASSLFLSQACVSICPWRILHLGCESAHTQGGLVVYPPHRAEVHTAAGCLWSTAGGWPLTGGRMTCRDRTLEFQSACKSLQGRPVCWHPKHHTTVITISLIIMTSGICPRPHNMYFISTEVMTTCFHSVFLLGW